MQRFTGLLGATLILHAFFCSCPAAAALGGAAPLNVALVRVSDLQPYTPDSLRLTQTAAATLRAAGYPANPQLSRPPLPRARDEPQQKQQQQQQPGTHRAQVWATPVTLGAGAPVLYPSGSTRRKLQQRWLNGSNLQAAGGFAGISTPTPAGTSALAVGPLHLLQAAGGVVTLHNLTAGTGEVLHGTSRSVALASLMEGAAGSCQGVFDPSATYDAAANRFLITATCGGQGLLLLAVSATSDAAGSWFVYSLVADGVGTALACSSPVVESAMVDYTQVSYNADGVFVTFKSICPSNSSHNGVGLLALPKWALYRGMPGFQYPIYTSAELAAGQAKNQGEAAGKDDYASCAQLVSVLPQEPEDVGIGTAWFVCEGISSTPQPHSLGRSITVAALLDTATLWQYGGPDSNTSAPLLAAQSVELDAPAPPVTGLPLRQPLGAPPLQQGTRPRGFWNGAAIMSRGKLFLATSTMMASDRSSPTYSRRPAVSWAELALSTVSNGVDTCPQSRAGAASRQAWDWSKDFSLKWGPQAAQQAAAIHAALAAPPSSSLQSSAGQTDRVISAASKLLLPGPSAHLPLLGAAQAGAVALFQLGAQPCTCYSCYWGGQYYRYGGYSGGALAGTGSGFASSGYYFQQGFMSRCQSVCTKCWYYGYPGHGFGNVGEDKSFLDLMALAPMAANISVPERTEGPSISTAYEADFTNLFSPCTRSGHVEAQVLRQGIITQGGAWPLGLAFPALAVTRSGELLVTFTYSGPGNATANIPAYPGVGVTLIQPGSTTSSSITLVKPGRGTIKPAALATAANAPLTGGWGELSAASVHGPSGNVFAAVHYAAAATAESSWVGTWITSWHV